MNHHLDSLFTNSEHISLIQSKLPRIFHIAEIECSRSGKVGMEVGSVRETILISLLIHVFGESNVNTEIPITESEIDVQLYGQPISIKTITGKYLAGIKAVWTVDAQSVLEFKDSFLPHYDMIFAQILWGQGWTSSREEAIAKCAARRNCRPACG